MKDEQLLEIIGTLKIQTEEGSREWKEANYPESSGRTWSYYETTLKNGWLVQVSTCFGSIVINHHHLGNCATERPLDKLRTVIRNQIFDKKQASESSTLSEALQQLF